MKLHVEGNVRTHNISVAVGIKPKQKMITTRNNLFFILEAHGLWYPVIGPAIEKVRTVAY